MKKLLVHLDHLIPKENIYYSPPKASDRVEKIARKKYEIIGYRVILEGSGLFSNLRKPDFQRQTNAWTPQKCVDFLDSVLRGWLVPHVILWEKPGSSIRYILDGAHRVSVVKAWMENDWGDSVQARRHYSRQDREKIEEAAEETRRLVKKQIGEFKEFQQELDALGELDEFEILQLAPEKRLLFSFFNSIDDTGLLVHWAENNSYEEVAQSFVRINKGGQPLDDFEVFLIEHRQSSFVRAIMSIANSGVGNNWPPSKSLSKTLQNRLDQFSVFASNIHSRLFEPTYEIPPTDVNQPFLPTPPYLRKHLYLREILPILVNNEIIRGQNAFANLVKGDEYNATPQVIVNSGYNILHTTETKLKHLTALTNTEPLSLDIVPIFYWYNRKGQLVRALCYGFMYWMLSGSDDDIKARKMIFSGNRDRFEEILHNLKPEIAGIHFSGGAALNTAKKTAEFFQRLLELLHDNRNTPADKLIDNVKYILEDITNRPDGDVTVPISQRRSGRNTSIDTYGKINKLYKTNPKCPICGGHIDWKRKHQLDHREKYSKKPLTSPDNLEETHNFCNNNRDSIEAYRAGTLNLSLPREVIITQLKLSLDDKDWEDENEFPFVEDELEEA